MSTSPPSPSGEHDSLQTARHAPAKKRVRFLLAAIGAVFAVLFVFLLLPDPAAGPPAPAGPVAQGIADRVKGMTRDAALAQLDKSAEQAFWKEDRKGEPYEKHIYRYPDGLVTVSISILRDKVEEAEAVGVRPGATDISNEKKK